VLAFCRPMHLQTIRIPSNTRHIVLPCENNAFSRRLPDLVTEELVFVLSQKRSYEFKQLFEVVHGNLRRRNAANGGEKMLRLRAYEKLQNLVFRGAVKKNGKVYTGDAAALAAMAANAPHVGAIASNLRVSGLLGRRGVSPVCRFGVFGRATDPARQ